MAKRFPLVVLLTKFHLISWDKRHTHLPSQDQWSFQAKLVEHASNWINFMNSDEIIPLGFQETTWTFSIKKGPFDFSGGFVKSWGLHYPGTFLCHADFIPDRSCLDVPVRRKCSACNGLALLFLYELQYISKAFPPSLPLSCKQDMKTLKSQAMWPINAWEYQWNIHWWFAHEILLSIIPREQTNVKCMECKVRN